MAFSDVFAKRLKELREAIGANQGEFAERIGVARQSISLYENGQRVPDVSVLERIVTATGCSPNYLLGLQDSMSDYYLDLSEETDLSESACAALRSLCSFSFGAMELMLESPHFKEIVDYMEFLLRGNVTDDFLSYKCHRALDKILEDAIEEAASFEKPLFLDRYLRAKSEFEKAAHSLDNVLDGRFFDDFKVVTAKYENEDFRFPSELNEDSEDNHHSEECRMRDNMQKNDKFDAFKMKLLNYGPISENNDKE